MSASPAAIARADTHRAYIRKTWRRSTAIQQAAALGVSVNHVRRLRSQLIRSGAVSPVFRRYSALWPADAPAQIRRMLQQGSAPETIARSFGRSVEALHHYCRGRAIDLRVTWTRSAIEALFGVPRNVVCGWRPALVPKLRHRQRWHVTRAQLLAFVEDRRYWPTYDPERISDPEIAAAARFARRMAGGRWVYSAAWARVNGCAAATARRWCQQGRITAIRIQNAWYVWEPA